MHLRLVPMLSATAVLCLALGLPLGQAGAQEAPGVDPASASEDALFGDAPEEEDEDALPAEDGVEEAAPSASAATSADGESAALRATKIGTDVLLVRPLSLAKLIAGAGFMYPASVFAAPNSMSVREEVVEVFWTSPLEDLTDRELGELE